MNRIGYRTAGILLASVMLLVLASAALAEAPSPSETGFYGKVYRNGSNVGAGVLVQVKSDGKVLDENTTDSDGFYEVYFSPEYDTVDIYAGGVLVENNKSAPSSGSYEELDLTIPTGADTTAPTITIDSVTSPTDSSTQTVTGTVTDDVSSYQDISVTVEGNSVPLESDNTFSTSVSLSEGSNVITVEATDNANNSASANVAIVLDTDAPSITLGALPSETTKSSVTVSGTVADDVSISKVTVNGTEVTVTDGSFSATVGLEMGSNTIAIKATDAAGNSGQASKTVDRVEKKAPVVDQYKSKGAPELEVSDVDAAVDEMISGSTETLGRVPTRSDIEALVDQLFKELYGI